jgi:hypothetical protein
MTWLITSSRSWDATELKCTPYLPENQTNISSGAYSFNKSILGVLLSVVLYGCEAWPLTLREERRLMVFEIRMLRIIFGPKRDEVKGNGENFIVRNLMICTAHPLLCSG